MITNYLIRMLTVISVFLDNFSKKNSYYVNISICWIIHIPFFVLIVPCCCWFIIPSYQQVDGDECAICMGQLLERKNLMKCGHNNFHERVRFHLNHGLKKELTLSTKLWIIFDRSFKVCHHAQASHVYSNMWQQWRPQRLWNFATSDLHEIHYNCV